MESIDRLRGFAAIANASMSASAQAIVADLADAIEREAMEERAAAYNDGYDAGFVDDNYDSSPAQHEAFMAERGWVRLPLDADGKPIHVGDVMEWDNGTFTVHELKVTEDGWTTWDEQHGYTVHVDVCRHHAPTVEDVLREFAEGLGVPVADSYVAAAAAKLTLRGDE